MEKEDKLKINDDSLLTKIYVIRDCKVMLDRDISALYGVETKYLKRQVKRNIQRFPEDFMFQLTKEELNNWRCHFGTSNSEKMGLRYLPFAFTENGVAMLSSVLHSERAIQVNIQIMRLFSKMRVLASTHQKLIVKITEIEKRILEQDGYIGSIFEILRKFNQPKHGDRRLIGYKRSDE